ncbi:hypothetical protein FQA39_LY13017 [Lamprigera yunnana]|nr:hypothetical protein FQA39_LY13017 [Lamprigera yunnana]
MADKLIKQPLNRSEYAVEMENISMIFNKTVVANKDINLKVKRGEIHALVGENGAGKSTLMSVLFGLYEPTAGSIKINDTVANSTVGAQQRAEILKILYRDVDILIFDEPTAVLTPQEIDGLLKVMKYYKKMEKQLYYYT